MYERKRKNRGSKTELVERNSQRLRNVGALAFIGGGVFGLGWLVLAGGSAAVVGQIGYEGERSMRQTSTKHKKEEKK